MPETDIFDEIKVSNWKTQNEINQKAVKKEWTGQHARLLDLLKSRDGRWVDLREILDLRIAQYGRVINDLRKGGENIENHKEWSKECKQWHSWFRWTP